MIPEFLIEMLRKQYGEELSKKIIAGYGEERKVTLRVNTIKTNSSNIEKVLVSFFCIKLEKQIF